EPYLTVSQDAKDYFLGLFGAPPGPVDPEVRKLVIGSETPITVGPADVLDPALPAADRAVRRHHWDEAGGVTALHYLLFPGPTRRLFEGEAHVERLEDEATPEPEAEAEAVIPDGGDLSEAIGDAAAVPLEPPPPPAPVAAAEPDVAWREFTVEVEGEVYEVRVGARDGGGLGSPATAAPASGPAPSAQGGVKAPMQGLIAKVVVKPGDQVAVGQTVVVLEAMKMQNDIPSDRAGVVGSVLVAEGQVVSRGEVLVTVG
ncbi:MAG: biotin/lipoyl-containing protein, partial [Candidatus Dormibacteria bacterium]